MICSMATAGTEDAVMESPCGESRRDSGSTGMTEGPCELAASLSRLLFLQVVLLSVFHP